MLITKQHAIEIIKRNGIVALPTETVYGLFGRADSVEAIQSVYAIKNRPADNPLICHFYSVDQIKRYVSDIPDYFETLALAFWPGPLTLIVNYHGAIQLFPHIPLVKSLAIRIPNNSITLQILKLIDIPLFGPSANTSTRVSGTSPDMIEKDLGSKIQGIVDGGIASIGVESTILDCRQSDCVRILRPGAIGVTELKRVLGNHTNVVDLPTDTIYNIETDLVVPGNKYRHYSPKTKIKVAEPQSLSNVIIGFEEDINRYPKHTSINLGSEHNLPHVAQHLFQNLNTIDSLSIEEIYLLPNTIQKLNNNQSSIGKAIANRISKAISPYKF